MNTTIKLALASVLVLIVGCGSATPSAQSPASAFDGGTAGEQTVTLTGQVTMRERFLRLRPELRNKVASPREVRLQSLSFDRMTSCEEVVRQRNSADLIDIQQGTRCTTRHAGVGAASLKETNREPLAATR